MMDRLIVHTVHTDDGATEVYWTRANDDFPDAAAMYNSVLLQSDGSLTWKGWTDSEVPVSVTIHNNRVMVAASEDYIPANATDNYALAFDSRDLHEQEA